MEINGNFEELSHPYLKEITLNPPRLRGGIKVHRARNNMLTINRFEFEIKGIKVQFDFPMRTHRCIQASLSLNNRRLYITENKSVRKEIQKLARQVWDGLYELKDEIETWDTEKGNLFGLCELKDEIVTTNEFIQIEAWDTEKGNLFSLPKTAEGLHSLLFDCAWMYMNLPPCLNATVEEIQEEI